MANEEKESAVFGAIDTLPPDAIFFTKQAYKADTDPRKVNLGIGAYRDDDGNPEVLDVVKKAEAILLKETENGTQNKEYLPISGDPKYVELSQQLILGSECKRITTGCVAGVQAISGTGSLRVLFNFIKNNFAVKNDKLKILISNPTWGNHKKVIGKAGLNFDTYTYWDPVNKNLNLDGMLQDLKTKGNAGDVVLLHACAHNPTGVDPTKEQWQKIADTIKEAKLVPFFDSAYQGFATGDLANDAFAVRLFEQLGFEFFIAQSFSKNLGLYCERAGCASIVCKSPEAAKACMTQLCAIIRPMYSNPPAHGARIVKCILSDEALRKQWIEKDMKNMSDRILKMRQALFDQLTNKLKTPGTWNHITDQIGMFTFTGLTPKQVDKMTKEYHIYLLKNGRVSMAGVAASNVEYIAKAIDDVVRTCKE